MRNTEWDIRSGRDWIDLTEILSLPSTTATQFRCDIKCDQALFTALKHEHDLDTTCSDDVILDSGFGRTYDDQWHDVTPDSGLGRMTDAQGHKSDLDSQYFCQNL